MCKVTLNWLLGRTNAAEMVRVTDTPVEVCPQTDPTWNASITNHSSNSTLLLFDNLFKTDHSLYCLASGDLQ
jgi:hypothetical protein